MSESRSPFRIITQRNQVILAFLLGSVLFFATLTPVLGQETTPFQLVEATIEDIHDAIKSNQITCQELVQQYIRRAKAYNGVCTQLITEDSFQRRLLRYPACSPILMSMSEPPWTLEGWKQRYRIQPSSSNTE